LWRAFGAISAYTPGLPADTRRLDSQKYFRKRAGLFIAKLYEGLEERTAAYTKV
jgi:hypothetical protein